MGCPKLTYHLSSKPRLRCVYNAADGESRLCFSFKSYYEAGRHYPTGQNGHIRTNGGAWQLHYIHRDYLGSIVAVSNSSGSVVESNSYDAWGRLRNASTLVPFAHNAQPTLTLRRGYTGHEHLPEFGLINMNARMYDPVLGRFLSPDPYVQMPDFSQSFNRYSYCLNNPLIYTDPDGEFIRSLWFGICNTVTHALRGDINSFGDAVKYFAQGAGAGFLFNYAYQFMPAGLQNIINGYSNAQITTGVAGMLGGLINDASNGFGGNGAFGRAGKLFLGNFYLDENRWLGGMWQGFTRHTWEIPQQFGGHFQSQWRNSFGHVTDVEYFGGATWSIDANSLYHMGNTWGSFINIKDDHYNKTYMQDDKGRFLPTYDPMYMHEYGHTFDSRLFGISYLLAIGIPSAIFNAKEDIYGWTEIRANRHAKRYFRDYFDVDWDGKSLPKNHHYGNKPTIEDYYPTRRRR